MTICWRCGSEFECGAAGSEPCWCMTLPKAGRLSAGKDCLCPACLSRAAAEVALVPGLDFYQEGAAMVFTEAYHLRRGYCCGNLCRHCPYRSSQRSGPAKLAPL